MSVKTVEDFRRLTDDQVWQELAACQSPGYYQMAVEELQRRHLTAVRLEVQSLARSSTNLERLTRRLIGLTVVLVLLTIALVWQTFTLIKNERADRSASSMTTTAGSDNLPYAWAFAQNLDGSTHPNELCRTSLADSLYYPANADRLIKEGSSNIFLFRGTIESYRVHAFHVQSECEAALSALVSRSEKNLK